MSTELAMDSDPRFALRQAAQETMRSLQARLPTQSIQFQSRGHLLIIGRGVEVLPLLSELSALPAITLLLDEPVNAILPENCLLLLGRVAKLSGHLGQFECCANLEKVGETLLTELQQRSIDLVLDLSEQPLIRSGMKPAGYFRLPADSDAQTAVVAEMLNLQGEFEKPNYLQIDPSRCMHSRSGLPGCDRCMSVCPAWAIQDAGDHVSVDANLCHGVGSCATACPTGAIQYDLPAPVDFRTTLRAALAHYWEGEFAPSLLIHAGTLAQAWQVQLEGMPDLLPVPLEELPTVGLESWLSALAWGAGEVILLTAGETAESEVQFLQQQVALGRHILEGLTIDPDRLRLLQLAPDQALGEQWAPCPRRATLPAAQFAANSDKQAQLWIALDALRRAVGVETEVLPLAEGAPFGQVKLDSARCTLCMSCVSICGLSALLDGGETPRLDFVENNCIQCGLCVVACPEQALQMSPRLLLDSQQRRARQPLKAEAPFRCIRCSNPFATTSVIERMLTKLAGHSMYAGEQLSRLKMCEDCRVIDLLHSETEH